MDVDSGAEEAKVSADSPAVLLARPSDRHRKAGLSDKHRNALLDAEYLLDNYESIAAQYQWLLDMTSSLIKMLEDINLDVLEDVLGNQDGERYPSFSGDEEGIDGIGHFLS